MQVLHKILQYFKKNPYLLFLCAFVVVTRLPVLVDHLVPFQFDHGKDAIGTLHMWWTYSPKLIGPWTSIQGLFFGPAWYYLLLPGMVMSGGSPLASVVTMVLLGLITIVIVYRYFGWITATVLATSSLFYTITTSAWNPFPMVCLTFILLAILKEVEHTQTISLKQTAALGFFAALGFHFSTAFAVFYPLLLILSLVIKKIKLSSQHLLVGVVAFFIPFIPQVMFELKHNFIEVKAVLAYLQTGDSDPASLEKFNKVISVTWGELQQVLLPPGYFAHQTLNTVLSVVFAVLLLISCYFYLQKRKKETFLLSDAVVWFTVPLLGFTFLHFNLWYVLPLAAFTYVLLGQVLAAAPRSIRYIFITGCFLMALSKVVFYISTDRENFQQNSTFLAVKQEALQYIYDQAGGRAFASYHYMPDIYDYPYQYLYMLQARNGQRLPTEFSYKPGEVTYIPEKTELLEKLDSQHDSRNPEVIFYVVESSDNQDLLDQWWDAQEFEAVIDEKAISSKLTVFTATPSN